MYSNNKYTYSAASCSALIVSNGSVSYARVSVEDGRFPVDTIATFTCNSGYYVYGDLSATCTALGIWSQQTPTCRGNNIFK